MKAKKVIAIISAAAMMVTPITAFAAPSADPTGTGTASGDGDINYVDASPVYEVTLPTDASLRFVVDPQGLVGLEEGESQELDDLMGDKTMGSILSSENSGAHIKNESSVPIEVSVKMKVTTDSSALSMAATKDELIGNTDSKMLLLAIPGSAKTADITTYSSSSVGIPITSTVEPADATFKFLLAPSTYKVKNNADSFSYEKDTAEGNFDAASFKMGGYVNKDADWSEFVKQTDPSKVSVDAVFSYEKAAEDAVVGDTNAYALEAVSGAITLEPENTDQNVLVTDGTNDIVIYYSGTKAENATVTPITITGSNKTAMIKADGPDVTITGDCVTIKASWLSVIKANVARGTGTYLVTINGTDYTITMN